MGRATISASNGLRAVPRHVAAFEDEWPALAAWRLERVANKTWFPVLSAPGAMCRAVGWGRAGRMKGFARINGRPAGDINIACCAWQGQRHQTRDLSTGKVAG
ncbi:MAG: hypothetical protein OXC66_04950 [Roseovarius sp.]|nr:hypothetical protein [Roseovarius sp.]